MIRADCPHGTTVAAGWFVGRIQPASGCQITVYVPVGTGNDGRSPYRFVVSPHGAVRVHSAQSGSTSTDNVPVSV